MTVLSEKSFRDMSKKCVHLTIGQLFSSREPAILETLLGSCVSACLYDPIKRVGGMNHILLPGNVDFKIFNDSARYGINAMEILINEMMKIGAQRSRMTAKIFGGAHVLAGIPAESGPGAKNIEFVLQYLQAEKIALVGNDTGGSKTRIIQFHTDTHEVYVKKIQQCLVRNVLLEEERYRKSISEKVVRDADITMF